MRRPISRHDKGTPTRTIAVTVAAALFSIMPSRADAQTSEPIVPLPVEIPPSTPAPDAPPPAPLHAEGPGFSVWGPYEANFRGGWLFDTYARGGLRARSEFGRTVADVTSDVLLYSLIVAPIVNASVYSLSQGGDWVALTELQLVTLEAFALVGLSTWVLKAFIGRERPYATAGEFGPLCSGPLHALDVRCDRGRNTSFVSGHAAFTFTAAGLVCAQSAYLGDPSVSTGRIACGIAMGGASMAAMLRIIADRHYATDTLAGMILGLTSGLAIPVLLHFINDAWLPPARTLPFASQPRDFGPMVGVGLLGLVAGSLLPLFTVPFRAVVPVQTSSLSPRRALTLPSTVALIPMFTAQGTGLSLVGSF